MILSFKSALKTDTALKWIFWGGLVVQLLYAITSVGYHFPDQHFQIIEFSSAQSGEASGAPFLWEWSNHVRPTIQVYLFTAFHQLMKWMGVHNPFAEMTILRILLCIPMYLLFNLFTYTFLKQEKRVILLLALTILNFSWFLPYLRTQYSAEMFSSFFFFGTVLLYNQKKEQPGFAFLILIGLLFGFTFYIRMQSLLFLLAFAIWLIYVRKARQHVLPILIGFMIGCAINLLLDSLFYRELIFTPYAYFHANIIEGRAASMGTQGFWYYIGILVVHTAAPFINIVLLYYGVKAYRKNYFHLVFLSVALFFIGHCFVGHKEDRFLFPIFNALPVILGFGLTGFLAYYSSCKKWIRIFLRSLVILSVAVNIFLLTIFVFTPWCQTVWFLQKVYNKFEKGEKKVTIYYTHKIPFGNPEAAPLIYYQKAFRNVETVKLNNTDTLQQLTGQDIYLAITFRENRFDLAKLDSLGYKPVLYSSQMMWKINGFLFSRNAQTINEIWALYKKEENSRP